MDKIVISGGARLEGEVAISGSKNAALPVIAACLLAPGRSVIHNVPRLQDVETMLKILKCAGVEGKFTDSHSIGLDCSRIESASTPYDLVKQMRASILILGALLGRCGQARVALPGGCVIGPRPIDIHLKGLKQLGAKIEIKHGYIHARARELVGDEIFLGGSFGSSVGATINLLLAASRARGTTLLINAACEPEVVDTADCLRAMGAKISGAGGPRIMIEGVAELRPVEFRIIPDRIEAGTYLIAGVLAGRRVILRQARPEHLAAVVGKLRECGAKIETASRAISVFRSQALRPSDVTTQPYPGFPTDMQAQMMALFSVIPGISVITEKVYPERFMHVPELNRMGARISLEGAAAIVHGVKSLSGAPVMASDLRASAALILAGLVADGETVIDRVYHLDRGYEMMEKKLRQLGAKIKRIR